MSTSGKRRVGLIEAWLAAANPPANTALADHAAAAASAGRTWPSVLRCAARPLRDPRARGARAVCAPARPGERPYARLLKHARAVSWCKRPTLCGAGSTETLAPGEERCASADFVRDGTRLGGIAEMLRGGDHLLLADWSLVSGVKPPCAPPPRLPRARGPSDQLVATLPSPRGRERVPRSTWPEPERSLGRVPCADARIGPGTSRRADQPHGMKRGRCSRARAAWRMSSTRASPCTWRSSPEPQNPRRPAQACRTARVRRVMSVRCAGSTRSACCARDLPAIGAGSREGADLELLARRRRQPLSARPQADLRLGARSPLLTSLGRATALGLRHRAAWSPPARSTCWREARAAALHLRARRRGGALRMATLGGAIGARSAQA